jgi:hypothetical protein
MLLQKYSHINGLRIPQVYIHALPTKYTYPKPSLRLRLIAYRLG